MTETAFDDLPDPTQTQQLLRRARDGDRAALDQLVERHQGRLLRIVRVYLGRNLRSHLESMDVVQAANEVVLRKIGDLQAEDPAVLLRWMTRIVVNQIRAAHDHLHAGRRDVDRQQPLEAVADPERTALGGVEIEADQSTPSERAARNEVRELLDQAVTALPDDQRQVIVLRDYCGSDWDEIAAEFDRTQGAVRMLHQRAWDRVRANLMPRLDRGEDR